MNPGQSSNSTTTMSTFTWLVKREYWEHRGGFLWVPFIAAMIMVALTLMMVITAEFTASQHGINLSGMNLGQLLSHELTPERVEKVSAGLNIGLLGMSTPIMIALCFVVFFYLLGALYDDRRDRSVLFWKSLPISDLHTVLAKVVAAVLLAPALAVAAMIALHLAFLVVMSLDLLVHGVNPLLVLWSPTHLAALWLKLIVFIPVNALWALPTIGWLLLCSSFARSKPFLWAVLLPIAVGVMVSWVNLFQHLELPSGWYWKNIGGRILFSIVPGTWMDAQTLGQYFANHGGQSEDEIMQGLPNLLSFHMIGDALTSPELWIGVVAGTAMIAAAVYFRRKRTESYA